jgi:hypothetical protein
LLRRHADAANALHSNARGSASAWPAAGRTSTHQGQLAIACTFATPCVWCDHRQLKTTFFAAAYRSAIESISFWPTPDFMNLAHEIRRRLASHASASRCLQTPHPALPSHRSAYDAG